MNELLDDLDPEQRQVATQLTGPMCVLAGAGTGKTRAITYRIAYAVQTGVHQAQNILAVTFTKRAASEMRSRLRDLGVNVQARTFHSAALSQLQYFWPHAVGGRVPEIKEHKGALVSQAAGHIGMPTDRVAIRDLSAEIEWAKVSLITPEEYPQRAVAEGHVDIAGQTPEDIARLIRAYEDVKVERGVIDFEDVILILIGIMRDRPDVTREIRRQYKHFVVDEFQDVSPMQFRLLQMWMGDRKDLCVVGDVSQTIYSFAGASATYLANFRKYFPRAHTVSLNRDYRSTPQVVELANEVIAEDGHPAAVHLRSMKASGRPVHFTKYADDASEANEIAGQILSLREQGAEFSDIAILYRTNAQSAEFETQFSQAGIPVVLRGSERFFQRREVKTAMVALRSVSRGESSGTLPELVEGALMNAGWRREAPETRGAARERWEALETIRQLAADMWDKRKATIREFVAELEERAALQNEPETNAVTLSSLHAAKGLEWQYVFLVGMSEGLMPISLAKTPEAEAEERRLLYVGITRAKDELFISYAAGNAGRGNRRVSQFLDAHWPGEEPSRSTQSRRKSKQLKARFEEEYPDDVALFEELRAWRAVAAQETGRKPYVIMHDTTLRHLAVEKPRNLSELSRIKGIGERKLTEYGPAVLSIINAAR